MACEPRTRSCHHFVYVCVLRVPAWVSTLLPTEYVINKQTEALALVARTNQNDSLMGLSKN